MLAPAILLAILIIWETVARLGLINALFFPPPSTTAKTLVKMIAEDGLLLDAGKTLWRLSRGFILGGIPGLLAGWLMGWSPRARATADPFIAAIHPIPKIALLPLIMIIFGIGEASKTVAISIGVFFPLLINSMTGTREISPIHFEVAKNLGASRAKVLTRIVIPGSLPFVMAGLRLAFNIGLLITIAVELVAANNGLGHVLWHAWETFRPEEIYAALVVLCLIGVSSTAMIKVLTQRLVPWRHRSEI